MSFESQRKRLSRQSDQSKRPRFRKLTNHCVVNPNPIHDGILRPQLGLSDEQQLFAGRRSQVLRISLSKSFVLIRDCMCLYDHMKVDGSVTIGFINLKSSRRFSLETWSFALEIVLL